MESTNTHVRTTRLLLLSQLCLPGVHLLHRQFWTTVHALGCKHIIIHTLLFKRPYTCGGTKKYRRKPWNKKIGLNYRDSVGHVVGMGGGRTVKKLFESKPEGNRRRGRTRLRWIEDLRKMKVKRWQQKAVGREEWPSVIGRPRLSGARTAEQWVGIRRFSSYRAVNACSLSYKNLSVNTTRGNNCWGIYKIYKHSLFAESRNFLMLNMLVVHKVTTRFLGGKADPA